MARYHVNLDERDYDVEVTPHSEHFLVRVGDKTVEVKNYDLSESRSLLYVDNRSYEVDIRFDETNGGKIVFMTGHEIHATVEDYNLAQLRRTAGIGSMITVESVMKAPMPGLVVDIRVAPGDKVKKGTPLIVIEAMKMENIIKARGEGTVKAIHIADGQSVEKGDKLVEFE